MTIKHLVLLHSLFCLAISTIIPCPCSQRGGARRTTSAPHQTAWSSRMKMYQEYSRQRARQATGYRGNVQNVSPQNVPTPNVGTQQPTNTKKLNTPFYAKASKGKQPATQQPQTSPAGMSIEWAVLSELNAARSNPQGYIVYLQEHKRSFINQMTYRYGQYTMQTKEGLAVVDETIRFMKSVQPISQLILSQGLMKAALDHALDIGPKGILGHNGSANSNPSSRMNVYGSPQHTWGENLAFGHADARQIVMQLIIDDGVKDRGHRKNIFNPDFHVVGIAYGGHKTYRCMCVIDFAGDFIEK